MTKILLVEDDKSLREIYGVRLLAEGYDIVSAGDGEEALAMAIKERPELIISDVMMPKISGFDMLDILRSTTETKDIRVIMMTALSSEDQRARGQALGADKYLVKSQVGIEDVVRTVHEVLKDAPVTSGVSPTQTFGGPAPSTPPQRPAGIPTPPPRPTSPAPTAAAPTPPMAPAPAPTPVLPQPTAPFSTARPSGLGERVIHPITPQPAASGSSPTGDLASRMDEELQNAVSAPAPTPPPPAPVPPIPEPPLPTPPASAPTVTLPEPPTPPQAPVAPVASPAPTPPQGPSLDFEEIPRPPAPPSPAA